MPATVANASAARARPARSRRCRCRRCRPATPARSSALDLGPINLNLLGLVVRTNQIQLRIDAVQGPGNLLGNLLCGITGILNPSGALAQHAARPARADPQRAARALAAHRLTLRTARRRLEPAPASVRPLGTLAAAWSSSPASSPPGASTSATTSGRSSSTSRARTGPIRRSTASSTCTRTTVAYDPAELRQRTRDTAALLVAAGLDPERCILFRQGDVPEHTELTWLLSSVTSRRRSSTGCTSSATRRAPRASARPRGCCSTRC